MAWLIDNAKAAPCGPDCLHWCKLWGQTLNSCWSNGAEKENNNGFYKLGRICGYFILDFSPTGIYHNLIQHVIHLIDRVVFPSCRWFCNRVPRENKPGGALCTEEDVCQQWAWSAGVQAGDSDYGESLRLKGVCLSALVVLLGSTMH